MNIDFNSYLEQRRSIAGVSANHGIPVRELEILLYLGDNGYLPNCERGPTGSQIAERLGVSNSLVSGATVRMFAKGLVKKTLSQTKGEGKLRLHSLTQSGLIAYREIQGLK